MVTRLCLLLAFISNAAWAANTLVINANVITVDRDHPSAQAFAFDNRRFSCRSGSMHIRRHCRYRQLTGESSISRLRMRFLPPMK